MKACSLMIEQFITLQLAFPLCRIDLSALFTGISGGLKGINFTTREA